MRSLVVLALVLGMALPAVAGEAPALAVVAQDPLMRQINKRLTDPDGGFQSVTWVTENKNGKKQQTSIVIDGSASTAPLSGVAAQGTGSESALRGLAVDQRLAAERLSGGRAAHGYRGRVRAPVRQLHHIAEHSAWQQ